MICYGQCQLHVLEFIGWTVTDDGCFEWKGQRNDAGYGVLGNALRTKVHRLAWEQANGEPVPDGLVIRHHCDNPPCCNPEHLAPGTDAQNTWDSISRGRRKVSAATLGEPECEKGHDLTLPNATYMCRSGKAKQYPRCRECRHEWDACKASAARGVVLR